MKANGRLIRRLREDAGLSLDQLADRAGVSAGYLSKVERNHITAVTPTPRWVAAVAAALDVPSRALLLDDEEVVA